MSACLAIDYHEHSRCARCEARVWLQSYSRGVRDLWSIIRDSKESAAQAFSRYAGEVPYPSGQTDAWRDGFGGVSR